MKPFTRIARRRRLMRYERWLPVGLASTALLGTLLLGMGQRDPVRPLLMLSVAITSVYFTDWKGWLQLNRAAANVGALAAAGMALMDFSRFDRDQWLLAIANLLVYLQIVLLYQRKNSHRSWQILVMSLLQVIVAAVLSLSVIFGLLLILYLFVVLATLALFFVHREAARYPACRGIGAATAGGTGAMDSAPDLAAGAAPAGSWPLGRAPALAFSWGEKLSERGARRGNPTGLAGRPAATRRSHARLRFFTLDAAITDQRAVRWDILRNTTRLVGATLVVAVVIFFSIPRFGSKPWQATGGAPRRVVGFSHEIQLGELGYVAENPELVMRLQLLDVATNQPLKTAGDLLLRGAVVTWYDPQMRRWKQRIGPYSPYSSRARQLDRPPPTAGLICQKITLEPLSEPVVWCVFPSYQIESDTPVRFNPEWDQFQRPERIQRQQVSFRLGTLGIHAGRQVPITPQQERPTDRYLYLLRQWPRSGGRLDQPAPLAGLKRAAAQVLLRAGVEPADRIQAAQAMTSFLRDSGRFQYTLQPPAGMPRGVDPIEDFVVRRRRGHCEYFASALALMLRSQGIPARVVIGLKGGDWNSWGRFYEFRQLHAHAWVEVYLTPQQVAGLRPAMGMGGPGGGWLTLDPTPVASMPITAGTSGVLASTREAVAYAQMLWTSYVVGLNQQKQLESIYAPITRFFVRAVRDAANPRAWRARVTGLFRQANDRLWSWLDGRWFSWRGGLAAMAACLALVGIYQLGRLTGRWLRGLLVRRRRRGRHSGALGVQFYNRFETLLRSHGITRAAATTQQEFAGLAGRQLAQLPQSLTVAAIPSQIVAAFYRVRFGQKNLDKQESEAVERDLTALETALRQTQDRPSRAPS